MSAKKPNLDETPKPKPKQASAVEIAQRIEEIMLIRLSGAAFHDVRNYATEKGWQVSRAQLYRYQQQADDLIADSLEKDRPRLLDLHVARRRTLYARCVESGDWRAALAIADSEARLLGLFPPTRIAPTNPDGTESYAPLTDAERAAALAALYARLGAGAGGPPLDEQGGAG
jgi:hypothetical protein